MKFSIVFIVLCLVAYSTQTPKFNDCDEKVKEHFDQKRCINVNCFFYKKGNANISVTTARSCPFPRCEKGQEYKGITPGDESAVYPDCCATPICE